MAHVIYEYTANIAAEADIPALLKKTNQVLIDQNAVFPTGGIRSRAVLLQDYCVADGMEDDAFVHVTVKYGAGRSETVLQQTFDALFEMIKNHFAPLYAKRYLALSMEVNAFSEAGTYKHNNIHARFKK